MTYPGSRNHISWRVVHPSFAGNCTIRFGNGLDKLEESFSILYPLDGSGDMSGGKFVCGRDLANLESKEV
jgi:hypothetical protein